MEWNTQSVHDFAEYAEKFYPTQRIFLDSLQELSVDLYMYIDTVKRLSSAAVNDINSINQRFLLYTNRMLTLIRDTPEITDEQLVSRIEDYEERKVLIDLAANNYNQACIRKDKPALQIIINKYP